MDPKQPEGSTPPAPAQPGTQQDEPGSERTGASARADGAATPPPTPAPAPSGPTSPTRIPTPGPQKAVVAAGDEEPRGKYLATLSLAALGVVYGDIGTSPLYALRECFHGPHAIPVSQLNVLGVLSLIFWSLILIVSVKYLGLMLRAHNRGEGGIIALLALILQLSHANKLARKRVLLLLAGLFGASLLYGDGVLTPAITVLSAVEGISIVTDAASPYVVYISLGIIIALFWVQSRGTAEVGAIFGPMMVIWFTCLTLLGVRGILMHPSVVAALNPAWAVEFFLENRMRGFLILGSVFLVVTGGEALYADMGHFGKRPIRFAWFGMVLPALLVNYFGQGALLLERPEAANNPFYLLAPGWALLPMVFIATAAASIASQAVISGAFSLTRQAVQLGYSPRIEIVHTSATEMGQIYIPTLNWALAVSTILLVLGFRTSSNLTSAYGVSVSTTMVITSVMAYFVARHHWGLSRWIVAPVVLFFLVIEGAYWGSNIVKVPDGGWFPLVVGASVFTLMSTWKKGRAILSERLKAASLPFDQFLSAFDHKAPLRVPGTAVFMTGNPEGTPPAMLHNLKHNKVIHERVILLTILTEEVPHIPGRERIEIVPLDHNFFRVIARYGFMENPSVQEIIGRSKDKGLDLRIMETTFFLGRETLIPSKRPGMALWREALFSWMSQNARSATSFFGIPPNRVVELGAQVEL